jgi:hypothetical protein
MTRLLTLIERWVARRTRTYNAKHHQPETRRTR